MLDVDAAPERRGQRWAVPIIRRDQRLGVLDVEIDKDLEMDSDLIEELQNIANVSDEHDFPENLDRFFPAFAGKRKLEMRSRKKSSSIHVFRWESRETDGNPAILATSQRC